MKSLKLLACCRNEFQSLLFALTADQLVPLALQSMIVDEKLLDLSQRLFGQILQLLELQLISRTVMLTLRARHASCLVLSAGSPPCLPPANTT